MPVVVTVPGNETIPFIDVAELERLLACEPLDRASGNAIRNAAPGETLFAVLDEDFAEKSGIASFVVSANKDEAEAKIALSVQRRRKMTTTS
jgi:hypothetical protein